MSKRPKVRVTLGTPPSQRALQSQSEPVPMKDGKVDRHAFREYALELWEEQIRARRLKAIAAGSATPSSWRAT